MSKFSCPIQYYSAFIFSGSDGRVELSFKFARAGNVKPNLPIVEKKPHFDDNEDVAHLFFFCDECLVATLM